MTKASLKLQHEQSFLGILWYLLGPAMLFGILVYVFGGRLGADIPHYPLYLLLGIITWNFFSTATSRCIGIFISNAALIKAMPIRLELLVLSAVVHAFVSHLIEIAIFIVVMFLYGVAPGQLVGYACVLLFAFLFTCGMSMVLATLYVFANDIGQIWSVVTRAWWFATPIFYAPSPTGPGARYSLFNPLYDIISASREFLIYDRIPDRQVLVALAGFSVLSCVIGLVLFRFLRPRIVDYL